MNVYTEQMMIRKLESFGQNFLDENYGLNLNIPIKLNGRLSRVLGRFHFTHSGKSLKIDLSRKMIEYNEMDFVKNVLKHELIHYALFEIGLPFNDGDEYFESELQEHGVFSSGGKNVRPMKKQHIYGCPCGTEFYRNKKDGHNYICCSCDETLKYKRTIEPNKLVEIVK